jgi:hypothetical protein
MQKSLQLKVNIFNRKRYRKLNPFQGVSSKMYIYTNKPRKVLFALTKLSMTDEVTVPELTVITNCDYLITNVPAGVRIQQGSFEFDETILK